jgi:hypothetical protein
MKVYITFDVSLKSLQVKNEMQYLGYDDFCNDYHEQELRCYLPANALWKADTLSFTAIQDLKTVIEILNEDVVGRLRIKLERCIAVEFANWDGIEGLKHN